MRLVSADEQRNIEGAAAAAGLSIEQMVRRAGDAAFQYLRSHYPIDGKGIAVLCGKGGNAADGFVIAMNLLAAGAKPIIILCNGAPTAEMPVSLLNEALGKGVAMVNTEIRFTDAVNLIRNASLIVDAVFGIGFSGDIPPGMAHVFDEANAAEADIVSMDIPSGVDADSGMAVASAIRAAATLCVIGVKPAHVLRASAPLCGQIVYMDIGLPQAAYTDTKESTRLLTKEVASALLPKRAQDTHKYDFGSVVCAVGSAKYRGAAVLCARGALAGGAGLLYVASTAEALAAVATQVPEAILIDRKADEDGLAAALARASAAVVGCGLPDEWLTDRLVSQVLAETNGPVVIDAGGLDTVRRDLSMLSLGKHPAIVTPHTGEFARLLGEEHAAVYRDRLRGARRFATQYGAVTVLKSDNTVIALPDGEAYICTLGNSGLSKGGSGDLLSGLIGSLCATGIEAGPAAVLGVYLHARAADLAAAELPQQCMTPSIVADYLPAALLELEGREHFPAEDKKEDKTGGVRGLLDQSPLNRP